MTTTPDSAICTARPVSNIWRSLAVPAAAAARVHAMQAGFV
jgi:hypothetical protein